MSQNKDLQKTKLCIYHIQGNCGLGTSCKFAHDVSEIRTAPDLAKTRLCTNFMNGTCFKDNCSFAHGEAELVTPPSYKKKVCTWFQQGKCRNGAKCGFAHDLSELRSEGPQEQPERRQLSLAKTVHPPGLAPKGSNDDGDASTDVPSTWAPSESGFTARSAAASATTRGGGAAAPQEHLFRMMAGRGAAPIEHQVQSMGLAVQELQSKLSHVESMMLRTQVGQMQHTLTQLSEQCADVEAHLRTTQQPAPPVASPPCSKRGLNASAPAFEPSGSVDAVSNGPSSPRIQIPEQPSAKTLDVAGKGLSPPPTTSKPGNTTLPRRPLAAKPRCREVAPVQWYSRFEVRMALVALLVAVWVMVELKQSF